MRSGSKNAFSAVLFTEGRVVGLCWAKLKPKGPKADVIQKEAWPFYRTISGVRLYWVLEEPEGTKAPIAPNSSVDRKCQPKCRPR